MTRNLRILLTGLLAVLAIASTAWLIQELITFHDLIKAYSSSLAFAFVVATGVVAVASSVTACVLTWKLTRHRVQTAQAPDDVVKAAELQVQNAEGVIAQVKNQTALADLNQEIAAIRSDRVADTFHVVVFGTGSAGKTSLINAMMGGHVGKVEAVMGTTREGETHTRVIEGVGGKVMLTDTPGLAEIGQGGADRERTARELATKADLLLFVVDHDLIRSEYEPMIGLARQGKRSILVFNKTDRFPDPDRDAILDKLRERTRGVIAPEDVVAAAAAPRPMPVRVTHPDGTISTAFETEPPDIRALLGRVEAVLKREGDSLRAGNLLLRAHLVSKRAQEQLGRERDVRARAVVDKFQWITAATVFANPIPALDLMATGAVQFQMISEIAGVYGVEISSSHVKMIGGQMVQTLLKLGMVEAATSLIAGLFKSTLVGYAAGGAVQCVSMAYLTHIAGLTFREYFSKGQAWGDGGMQAALVRQFDLNSRADFLQEFAKQAFDKVINKALHGKQVGAATARDANS